MELRRGDEVLGALVVTGAGQPWFRCDFEPTPAFESVRALFAQDAKFGDELTDPELDELEDPWPAIEALELKLHVGGSQTYFEVEGGMLHIWNDQMASFTPLHHPDFPGLRI